MPTRNFDDPNDDEDLIDRGEYQGQRVQVRPDGAEWREFRDAAGKPLGVGRGEYVWEYECPVCRVFYFRGPEAREEICSYCEITHECLGAHAAQTPRRVAPEIPVRRSAPRAA